jgi:3-oxoacyl-[acyl-carrier protein] reductase
MQLQDSVVVVTGSSSGIGKAVAQAFAAQGARLIIHSKASVAAGRQVAQNIVQQGGAAVYLQADLEKPEEVKRLFADVLDVYGRLDVLVNNAGTPAARPFLETDQAFWLYNLNNIFLSAVLCSIEAAKIMKLQGWGKIINTTSMRGLDHAGRPASMAYSAAKAALNNFTKNLAKELAPEITVNAVAPGFVAETAFLEGSGAALRDLWLEETPLKRFARPDEVAETYLYLAQADFVTGEVLVIDGGFNMKLA